MSQSSTQSRKRDFASSTARSSGARKTKSTTPYSPEFEQKLADRGVFPVGYRFADGRRSPKPNNIQELMDALSRRRSSLSSTAFSEEAFEEFRDNDVRASESAAMADLLPVIAGPKDKDYNPNGEVPFLRLEKFDPDISVPKPDRYYGAMPAQIDGSVRSDLTNYIIPSNRTNLPAAPNFFVEMKGISGRGNIAALQAMYDGAVGAKGILHLQNYGNAVPVHDANAYTITVTYCNSTLKIYATHPRESERGGETEYFMTELKAYGMTSDPETFRKGAAAYRNAREWAQEQRDNFITNANAAALRMSADRVSVSRTEVTADASSTAAGGSFVSETSADELASDTHTVKRRRA